MVRLSPAERESTPAPEHGHALDRLSEYEYAVLSERLAELRHGARDPEYPFAS